MPVRTFAEAPEYLTQYVAHEAGGIIGCAVSQALGELEEQARQKVIESIQKIIAKLRAGRARKIGEVGPLQRLKNILEAAKDIADDADDLLEDIKGLGQFLNPDNLKSWAAQQAEEAIGGLVKEAARKVLPPSLSACAGPQAAIKTAQSLAPIASAVEMGQKVVELARQAQLLWNSVLDLKGLLSFELIAEEVINQLEDYLMDLIRQSAGIGADAAEAFLEQRLVPVDWIVAVGGPPREFDDV